MVLYFILGWFVLGFLVFVGACYGVVKTQRTNAMLHNEECLTVMEIFRLEWDKLLLAFVLGISVGPLFVLIAIPFLVIHTVSRLFKNN